MKNLWFRSTILLIIIVCGLSAATLGFLKYRESSGNNIVPVSDNIENDSNLSVTQMREDLDYLVRTLRLSHPSKNKVFDEKQNRINEEAYSKITKPMNSNDFYFIANEIVASINDGHTTLRNTAGNSTGIKLPIKWLSEGMIVSGNVDQLIIGDKVISIGGRTEKQLYDDFDKLIPAENQYWAKQRAQAELTKEPILRHLNLINKKNNVDLEIERNGTIIKISLPVVTNSPSAVSGETVDWVRWNIEKDYSLGILYLDKCTNDDTYKKTVNDFFKAVKENNLKNVALDLRANTGGSSSVTDIFLQYLNVDTYRGIGSGLRQNKKTAETDLIFEGNIFVLTSSRTFSAANLFTLTLKDNGIAKVLGEPTGNATTRYGEVKSYKLPNSNFVLGVASKSFSRPDANAQWQDAVYPDIEVYTTRYDIITGRDPQLERLRQECGKNKGFQH